MSNPDIRHNRRRNAFKGIMVPLVTPFTPSLDIDWPAFDDHVRYLLSMDIEVLIPGDLVGETWALTAEEASALLTRTVHLAAGQALVIAKLPWSRPAALARRALEAATAGAGALKLALPARAVSLDRAQDAFDACASAGLPFLLEIHGSAVAPDLIEHAREHPGFSGVEETSLDLDGFDLLVERFGAEISVIAGSEDALGFTLLLGAAGFMTATPNFAPRFMRHLWTAGASGDAAATLAQYRRLRRYRRLFADEVRRGRPMFVTYTKAALELLGRPVGPPRPPLRMLAAGETQALRTVLIDALGLTVP